MFHHLTIGFLVLSAIDLRRIVVERPLTPEVLELLNRWLDEGAATPTIGGHPVTINAEWIRCVWFGPRRNARFAEFAAAALELGCVVGDIEHARSIGRAELVG